MRAKENGRRRQLRTLGTIFKKGKFGALINACFSPGKSKSNTMSSHILTRAKEIASIVGSFFVWKSKPGFSFQENGVKSLVNFV